MLKPSPFPWTRTVEELREYLGLLPEMMADPAFPFGKKDVFDMLAIQIDGLYRKIKEAGEPAESEA